LFIFDSISASTGSKAVRLLVQRATTRNKSALFVSVAGVHVKVRDRPQ